MMSRMHTRLIAALAVAFAVTTPAFAATQPALSEPSISPDGRTIAFVSGGDVWTVPADGGDARLLVANPATESRPLFAPDGKSVAFVSNRTGNGDVYVVDLGTGDTRRVTFDDAREILDGWSRDGKWIYFSSNAGEADGGAADVWRVAAGGGTPMPVSNERMAYEYFAAPSPDGNSVAFVARGFANGQWWRKGHSHMDESQIFLLGPGQRYTAVTADGAKELWPMWAPDAKRIFYVSDRSGSDNLWSIVPGAQPQKLTNFTAGRVIWPAIAYDGKSIVFERDFGVWRFDTANGRVAQVPITLLGVASATPIEHRRINERFTDFALSPDGKKVVFVVRGEIFASTTKDPGDAVRVTRTTAIESQPVWSTDSKSIVYASDRDGNAHLFRYDFATEKETQFTSGPGADDTPRFSPDGKLLAFERNHKDIVVLDVAAKAEKTIATGRLDRAPFLSERPFAFSPDSRFIAYLDYGANTFRNINVVPVAGGESRAASFLANTNTDSLVWSHDGKYLLAVTGQRTEPNQIVRIDVVPVTPKFREEQFRELFRETPKPDGNTEEGKVAEKAPAEKKKAPNVEVEFNGIRDRIRVLPVGLDSDSIALSPDGKWVALVATVADLENVYIYSLDELATEPAVAKQISSSPGRKRWLQWSSDSKEIWYLDAGKIAASTIDPVKPRTLAVAAEMDVDFDREKNAAFMQAWTYLRDAFFDPKMRGVDWGAQREIYGSRVAVARTGDEFRRILSLMVGDLNASHLGASPQDPPRPTTGRLGVFFSPSDSDRLVIDEVVPLSPADVAKIRRGESIVAIDGETATRARNFDSLLEHKIGKRTVVTVAGADGKTRDVVLQPINYTEQRNLVYRDWVNRNRDYVLKASGGRLGYVHMYDMSSQSLQKLYVDLDSENRSRDGVVIDLRNNHGGFVNAYALDVFSRKPYMTMTTRDLPPAGARSALGQRSLEKPTILVVNRHSLSDAEDFTEGYRTMKLGEVVGEPTAGWIIYTGGTSLVDGTVLRMPGTRITDSRGEDMEMNPRPVDKLVKRDPGESLQGKDSQLDAAVAELLKAIR
jgi:Tol biopolymer transport system component/C-terminal processing protease CtpA/Prc